MNNYKLYLKHQNNCSRIRTQLMRPVLPIELVETFTKRLLEEETIMKDYLNGGKHGDH